MRLLTWMKEESLKVLPAVIYFAAILNFIHFNEGLVLGVNRYYSYLAVTVGAIIIGKILIIANQFNFVNAFPNKPLIYNILWKSLIYGLFIFIYRAGEAFIHGLWHFKNVTGAANHTLQQLSEPLFWSTEGWLFLAFFGYIVFNEFARVLGKKEIITLLFGKK